VADFEPGMTAPRIEVVTFLAGAQLPRAMVEEVIARTSARLAVACRLHVEAWDEHATRLAGRDQFDADSLLASLDATGAPGVVRIGLTAHDLGLALFTFVFGRAKKHGRAAIVSLARLEPGHYGLPPDPERYVNRAVAEIMHELGHVAGLGHCGDLGCIMYFATNVETIDLRGAGFCTACAGALPPHLLAPAGLQA
jgi:predicted Zn-dependent protease